MIEIPAIDLELYNMPNSLEKIHKTLSIPGIPLPKTLANRLKQSNEKNFLNKKKSLSFSLHDILKICCDGLNSPN